jgi:hypothetical protein
MKQAKKRNTIEIVAAADERVTWQFVGEKGPLAKSLETYRSPHQARRAIAALRHAHVVDRTAPQEIEPPEAHFAFAKDVDVLVAGEQARTARHRRRRREGLIERAELLEQSAEAEAAVAAGLHSKAETQREFAGNLYKASLEEAPSDIETAMRTARVAQDLAAEAEVQEMASEVLEQRAEATSEEAEAARDQADDAASES